MNASVDADDSNPALLACAQQAMKSWKSRVARIVEDGLQAREIRKGTDPRRIANVIISTLEGALMMSRLEGNRTAMRDAQAALEDVIAAIEL